MVARIRRWAYLPVLVAQSRSSSLPGKSQHVNADQSPCRKPCQRACTKLAAIVQSTAASQAAPIQSAPDSSGAAPASASTNVATIARAGAPSIHAAPRAGVDFGWVGFMGRISSLAGIRAIRFRPGRTSPTRQASPRTPPASGACRRGRGPVRTERHQWRGPGEDHESLGQRHRPRRANGFSRASDVEPTGDRRSDDDRGPRRDRAGVHALAHDTHLRWLRRRHADARGNQALHRLRRRRRAGSAAGERGHGGDDDRRYRRLPSMARRARRDPRNRHFRRVARRENRRGPGRPHARLVPVPGLPAETEEAPAGC